jgi:TonB-dependent SusC/RagA subfamily outer membrane receptor
MVRAQRSVSGMLAFVAFGWLGGCLPSRGGTEAATTSPAAAPSGYVEELFAGRFPGVRVFRLANGALSIEIRGRSTIHGSTQPLIVVDGMPLESEDGLLFLNPSDIQRIEVLKDVGSTAAYGVRGANGVVLITTAAYPAPRH